MNSLRVQLIFSHVLPSMIVIPIMGVVLIYVLENQNLLPTLKNDLGRDASLIASLTHDQVQIWTDPFYAQALLDKIDPGFIERTMLLRPDGVLLASTDPSDGNRLNQVLSIEGLVEAQAGKEIVYTDYNPRLQGEVVDVLTPVIGDDERIVGIVRLTYHYDTVYEEVMNLRYLIMFIIMVGLLINTLAGSTLALQVSRPIKEVTQAIFDVARGYHKSKLDEQGSKEIRLLASSVNFLAERLETFEQARRYLVANLRHELGRPIGALQTATQAILNGAYHNSQLFMELLEGMDDEFSRLNCTLEDLDQLNDHVLGPLELNRQPVDPEKWLAKVLWPWREAAAAKGIHLEVSLSDGLPTMNLDTVRMAQSIGNLISNAIKYTPPGGTISVSQGVDMEGFWIKVQDTGAGIAAEDQEKIFMPYYRVESTIKSAPGMGLGLNIAQEFVAAHGGKISVESQPGEGSTFKIWIPRQVNPIGVD